MTAIAAEELLDRKVGRFLTHFANKYSSLVSLNDLLNEIKGSHWEDLVSRIRKIDLEIEKERNESKLKELKEQKRLLKSELAAVTLSGVGHRKEPTNKTEPSFAPSGLLQIDLDKKDHPHLTSPEMFDLLKSDPHILACFLSPSGGVKGICAISQDEDDHLGCFMSAECHFRQLGLTIDPAPKNPKSLCYLSYDPEPYVATGMVETFSPIEVEKPLVHTMTQSPNHIITQSPKNKEEYKIGSRLEMIRSKKQIEEAVEKWKKSSEENPALIKFWDDMIERRYKPERGNRNHDLCDFIAYSMCRLSREIALDFAKLMRELWDSVYNDPMEQHMYEASMQWKACEYSFRGSLNAEEKEIYEELDDRRRSAFRICRGLAFYEDSKTTRGDFFLSCRDFGNRIGVSFKYASKLLNEFAFDFDIIKEEERGVLEGRKATRYKWMFISLE